MSERFAKDLKSCFKQKDNGSNENWLVLLHELSQYIGVKDLKTQGELLEEIMSNVNSHNAWGEGESYTVGKRGYVLKPTFVIQEETCLNCGKSIPTKKQGRPSKYCSVRCRVAHFRKGKETSNETIKETVTSKSDKPKKRKKQETVTTDKSNQKPLI
jgi:hypothetical protein